jgi:peptidoglycan/xylan/chitin deacetylase (PgdA/CDA1 family)
MLFKLAGEIRDDQQTAGSPNEENRSGVELLSTRPVSAVPFTKEQMPGRIVETPRPDFDRIATMPEVVAFLRGDEEGEEEAIDELPTQHVEVVDRWTAEQATLPLVAQRVSEFVRQVTSPIQRQRPRHLVRNAILSALYLSLVVALLVGHTAIVGWVTALVSPRQPQPTATAIVQSHHKVVHSTPIDAATQAFIQAFMHKDWPTIWSMLSPATQSLYSGESDFLHMEQVKFNGVTFSGYKLSATEIAQPWLDPDTTRVYAQASITHVSVDATASSTYLSSLSIADLQHGLFHNTQLALIPVGGRWMVALAGPADLDAPVLVPATSPTDKLLVPIFMYHHVSNKPTYNALDYSLTVTTTDFNAQLDWLQQQGFHAITMTELFDALYYGKSLPLHPMILSFDDGYADMYTDALPALLAHHYRGVFYIITGMIGGRYMTWNQVRALRDEGMQIASHTIHHVNIGEPPAYTTTQDELLLSKQTLEQQMGEPIQFFCYPTGEPFHHDTVAEQQLVLKDLYADGYLGATLDPFAYDSAIQDASTPYQLPRVRVSGGEPLQTYQAILNDVLTYDASQLGAG